MPLKVATEPLIKPVPVIVRVCVDAPAVTLDGETETMLGTGLLVCCWVGLDPAEHPIRKDKEPRARNNARARLKIDSQFTNIKT